ncbi:hypothetical protein PMAYCL1PPCAC_10133, partial [Pristionchus mayeri]
TSLRTPEIKMYNPITRTLRKSRRKATSSSFRVNGLSLSNNLRKTRSKQSLNSCGLTPNCDGASSVRASSFDAAPVLVSFFSFSFDSSALLEADFITELLFLSVPFDRFLLGLIGFCSGG